MAGSESSSSSSFSSSSSPISSDSAVRRVAEAERLRLDQILDDMRQIGVLEASTDDEEIAETGHGAENPSPNPDSCNDDVSDAHSQQDLDAEEGSKDLQEEKSGLDVQERSVDPNPQSVSEIEREAHAMAEILQIDRKWRERWLFDLSMCARRMDVLKRDAEMMCDHIRKLDALLLRKLNQR